MKQLRLFLLVFFVLAVETASAQITWPGWTKVSSEPGWKIRVSDSSHVVSVGIKNFVYSTDAGTSWQKPVVPKVWYYDINMLSNQFGWAVGGGTSYVLSTGK